MEHAVDSDYNSWSLWSNSEEPGKENRVSGDPGKS